MRCSACEFDVGDIGMHDFGDGRLLCDDCVLEVMAPEWVREHYPEAVGFDDADAEDEE